MTIVNSKNYAKVMIAEDYIATIKWDEVLAQRLEQARGKMSRHQLSRKTAEMGRKVSPQYLQQLEQPKHHTGKPGKPRHLTVSYEVLQVILMSLDLCVTDFLTSAKFSDYDASTS